MLPDDPVAQLKSHLANVEPTTTLLTLVVVLPFALQRIEPLVADPPVRDAARLVIKQFGGRWRLVERADYAEERALIEAFVTDAISRPVDGEEWTHLLAQQLLLVAAAHEGATTGEWAREAAITLTAAPIADSHEHAA